jgi:hypothetical protein
MPRTRFRRGQFDTSLAGRTRDGDRFTAIRKAREKLANPAVAGQPEDQLRNPFENLLADLAQLCSFPKGAVGAVGESSLSDLKTRPDFAVTVSNALVGFIDVKAWEGWKVPEGYDSGKTLEIATAPKEIADRWGEILKAPINLPACVSY